MSTFQTINIKTRILFCLFIAPFAWGLGQCTLSPALDLGPDTSHCGTSLVLDAGPDYASYLWTGGLNTSQISISLAGTSILTVTDSNGCIGSDTISVAFNPTPTATITPAGSISYCQGGSVTLQANTLGNFAYLWNTGTTSSNLEVFSPGTYSVVVFNSAGCSDTSAPVLITENSLPMVDIGPDQSACEGDTVIFDAGPGFSNYLWSDGASSQSILLTQPGGVAVSVRDTNGCTGTDTAFVNYFPNPGIDLGSDQVLCQNFAPIILNAGLGFASYNWSNGDTIFGVLVDSSGLYFVNVIDQNGCSGISNMVNITIHPQPTVPVLTLNGNIIETAAANGLQWYMNGILILGANSNTYTPTASGSYSVRVTDQNGCESESIPIDIFFEITQADIFNGISPNNDGINDNFVIKNIERFPDNELVITNRWGNEVYRNSGYINDWDGRGPDGQPLPDGSYYYILDLKNGQEILKGFLQINR